MAGGLRQGEGFRGAESLPLLTRERAWNGNPPVQFAQAFG
jgi:hypothetical protein